MPQAWEYKEQPQRPRHPPTQMVPWQPQQYSQATHLRRLAPLLPDEPPQDRSPQPSFSPRPQPRYEQPQYQDPQPACTPGDPRRPQPPAGYYPPQRYAPRPPQRGRHTARNVLAGIGGLILLIIVVSVAESSGHGAQAAGSSQGAPPAQAAAPAQPAARAAAATTVATFSGDGIQATPQFTVTSAWRLDYSFDCSNFGAAGNFIIMEDGGLAGAMDVNTLAMSKTSTSYAYNDAGQHYIKVDSECSWTLKVTDEG